MAEEHSPGSNGSGAQKTAELPAFQNHVVVLLATRDSREIQQATTNAPIILNTPWEEILGCRLEDILSLEDADLPQALHQVEEGKPPLTFSCHLHARYEQPFTAFVHANDTSYLIELEPLTTISSPSEEEAFCRGLETFMSREPCQESVSELAVTVGEYIGSAHTRIYFPHRPPSQPDLHHYHCDLRSLPFNCDGPDERFSLWESLLSNEQPVISAWDLDSPCVSLFPATSDASPSSREANKLISAAPPEGIRDGLSPSDCRSVFVTGMFHEAKLRAAIECRHHEPLIIPFAKRRRLLSLCSMMERQLRLKLRLIAAEAKLRLSGVRASLLEASAFPSHWVSYLRNNQSSILEALNCQGMALTFEGTVNSWGEAPKEAALRPFFHAAIHCAPNEGILLSSEKGEVHDDLYLDPPCSNWALLRLSSHSADTLAFFRRSDDPKSQAWSEEEQELLKTIRRTIVENVLTTYYYSDRDASLSGTAIGKR